MTGPLVWRVAVALVLAYLAGTWQAYVALAMWHAGNPDGALATVLFGVPLMAGLLVAWATDEAAIS